MKKIAVIGAGQWGNNLIRNFYQFSRLDMVCDKDKKVIEKVFIRHPDVKVSMNIEETLEQIDAVVIATPANTHYRIVKKAIKSNKDVFVEKPLALTLEQGKELVALAEEKKRILMVGHLLEYHPAIRKLKKLIDQGELGKIYHINSNRLNFGKIRKEENILWSFAPHDISVILRFLEEIPYRVYCTGQSYLTKGVFDVTISHLDFSGGIQACIYVNWLNPFKEQKLTVMGSKQMAVFDDTIPEKLVLYPHEIYWRKGLPIADKREGQVIRIEESEPLKIEVQHFLKCIDEHKKPLTDGKSALNVLRVLEACQMSLKKGERISPIVKKHFVVPTAIIEEGSKIGQGTKIWHYSHVMDGAKIGKNCNIGKYVSVERGAIIGNNVKIQNGVSIYSGVIIEDNVFIGNNVVFTNVKKPRSEFPANMYEKTLIKKGATIGSNATIICGVIIGEYSFVAAGAVVTKDISPYTLVAGVPAKTVGSVNKKGELED